MISKEEMRRARLIAMGASGSVSETAPRPITTETNVQHGNEQVEKRRHISTEDSSPLSVQVMGGIKKLMYENGGATDEDISRWYNQGFVFCESPSFGLRQENGGPCGILAVVQAEILKFAIFSNSVESVGVSKLPTPQIIEVQRMFANACSSILARAAEGKGTSDGVICILDCPNLKLFPSSPSSDLVVHRIHSESEASRFILERLELFSSSVGCIVFLFSLMLSRGLERLAQDMDIDSNTLIGPYGHCAQELLNLLLTGAASSNILDGNISMNGMIVKGISQRSSVGYLTQLESLRYCQAGNFYKVPIFPVWVIGSLSHFTVLFALDRRVNDETDSERLLNLAQRAFRAADPEENGFIPSDKLKEVLEVLKYDDIITNEVELARLRGHLQIDGGIILWSGFWENVSRLITKETTLDALINVSASGNHSGKLKLGMLYFYFILNTIQQHEICTL
jgi:ubiquitin carboxyl-terminal hydrolase MINDY-3/4